jgi:hypothetical protein
VADLGFSGVVEKFEEHWGKRPTRWLLLIIGLGVAAVCVGAIWEWLISPLLAFIGSPQRSQTIWALVLAIVGIGAGISLTTSLTTALARWRRIRTLNQIVSETETKADQILDRATGLVSKASQDNLQTRALLEASLLVTKALTEKDPTIGEDERAERLGEIERGLQELQELRETQEMRKKRGEDGE